MAEDDVTNLWLAEELWQLDGVHFGDFTHGRTTVHSPIWIDPKVLTSSPPTLRRAADLLVREVQAGLNLMRPRFAPFELVAGVPFGGLHLATGFSLSASVPMIYAIPHHDGRHRRVIEGRYTAGQQVLIIDDLMTTGGSLLETMETLQAADLRTRDAIVLVDRDQGGGERLRRQGLHLVSILKLPVMLNYYMAKGYITEKEFQRSMDYVQTHRAK